MFDRKKLEARIILSGYKNSEIPSKLGISQASFWRKLKGESEFKRNEIAKLIEILSIEDPADIFFTQQLTQKER